MFTLREDIVSLLEKVIVCPSAMVEYFQYLDGQGDKYPHRFNELIEGDLLGEVLEKGLSCLPIDELVPLAINSLALLDLRHEVFGLKGAEPGEIWRRLFREHNPPNLRMEDFSRAMKNSWKQALAQLAKAQPDTTPDAT